MGNSAVKVVSLTVAAVVLQGASALASIPQWNVAVNPNPALRYSCQYVQPGLTKVVDIVDTTVDSEDNLVPGYIRVTDISRTGIAPSAYYPLVSVRMSARDPNQIIFGFAASSEAYGVKVDSDVRPLLEAGAAVVSAADPAHDAYVSLPFGQGFYMNCAAGTDLGHFSLVRNIRDRNQQARPVIKSKKLTPMAVAPTPVVAAVSAPVVVSAPAPAADAQVVVAKKPVQAPIAKKPETFQQRTSDIAAEIAEVKNLTKQFQALNKQSAEDSKVVGKYLNVMNHAVDSKIKEAQSMSKIQDVINKSTSKK